MDRRLSNPPAKKFRGLSDLNMPMLECKREFPLPHKFPSINNSSMRNFKVKNYGTVTICKPETLVNLNGVKNKKEVITNGMKKLRIKTIDGKDLGEVKVQFLTKRNIVNTQKTTMLEQNGKHRSTNLTNLSAASANATSGPLNSSLLQSALEKSQNCIVKAPNTTGSRSKFYSKSTSANKLAVACKKSLPMQEKRKSVSQKFVVPKSNKTNESKMILVQKETACKAKESDIPKKVENCKAKPAKSWVSVVNYEKLSILKKKDAINGVAASSAAANKTKPSSGSELRCNESPKRIVKPFKLVCNSRASVPPSTKISESSTSPRKKPKDEEISDGENDVVIVCERNPSSAQYSNNSQEKSAVSLSTNNETVNNACTEIRNKLYSCEEGKGAAAVKEIAKDGRLIDCLNVIKEALTSVTDEELRAKALCALAECRISKAKEVPITPPEILKTVHDTQIQTDVFALLEANSFVLVKEDSPGLQRITQTERSSVVPPPVLVDVQTQTEPQTQPMVRLNHCIDNITSFPMWSSSPMQDTLNLDDFLGDLLNDDTSANKVKQALSTPQALCRKIAKQLEKDYEEMHCWDENGVLNIHRAVMDDQFQEVQRLLVVLDASKIDIDVLTDGGMTSLELAIKFGASKDIVELLLKAGAQPLIPELLHETAVLLASKQSSPLLPYLLSYVNVPKLLNRVDSTGFAPLHYCAYNGYLDGVNALIEKGADVNLKDNRSGRTPFFHALENKHGVVAQKLLENGAIADLPNFSGQSVLSLVNQSKNLFLKTSPIRSQRVT